MTGLIDYAGLFPPAALDLDAAFRNYPRYRTGRDGWMLGRFIGPAGRLAELAPYHDELFAGGGAPYRFSVLAGFGDEEDPAIAALEEDIRGMAAFREKQGDRVRIDSIETKLPEEAETLDSPAGVADYLRRFAGALGDGRRRTPARCLGRGARPPSLARHGPHDDRGHRQDRRWRRPPVRFQAPVRRRGPLRVSRHRLGRLRHRHLPRRGRPHEVDRGASSSGAPQGRLLGRHEPRLPQHVRRGDPRPRPRLAPGKNRGVPRRRRARTLRLRRRRLFLEERLGSAAEVARARKEFAAGYGSCSFDEPREGLAQLGRMEPIDDAP